ncbi:MAG: DUF2220 domain-containing protein [Lachnospiraceae bacterium]|nr:DUF2220 domain-containing protein [Lachnospiraceae bacterium]
MTEKQRKLLNTLIDKYERSATFRGESKVKQSFSADPAKLFPKYSDEGEYDYFISVNQDIRDLEKAGYVRCSGINLRIDTVVLNTDMIGDIYRELGRRAKKDSIAVLKEFLERELEYFQRHVLESSDGETENAVNRAVGGDSETGNGTGDAVNGDSENGTGGAVNGVSEAVCRYAEVQLERLATAKLPEYYEDSLQDYMDVFTAFRALSGIDEEIFVRDLSVRIFNDSKRLENLRGRISGCLYKYGDFSNKDAVFDELGVVRNPSYVMVKGPVRMTFGRQLLDIGELTGDIALSAKTLQGLTDAHVYGERVITVENLTSFHRYDSHGSETVIYLGGFHNGVRREFLRMIAVSADSNVTYHHFGDIDAGGFYIYRHLRENTGIDFRPYMMDRDTLIKYEAYSKPLTPNDIRRIERLVAVYENDDHKDPSAGTILETLRYMLEKGIKLEQEAVGW